MNQFNIVIFRTSAETDVIYSGFGDRLRFSTSLNGGFADADFDLPEHALYRSQKYVELVAKHVVIFDFYGDRVYEGKIVSIKPSGDMLSVSVNGYYSTASTTTAGPMLFSGKADGAIIIATINNAGTNYTAEDVLSVTGGDATAEITVSEVNDTTGAIEEFYISDSGSSYVVASGVSLTGGTGSSATLNITAVETGSTAYDIIRFYVDLEPNWRDDFSRLEQSDLVPIGPFEFDRSSKITSALEDVLKYGYLDSDSWQGRSVRRPLYFAVWDYRIAELIVEPNPEVDNPDWVISIHDLLAGNGLSIELSTQDIRNKIWAIYNDPDLDGSATTLVAQDTASQELYGVLEGSISVGNATLQTAELARDLALKQSAYPKQRASLQIVGTPRTYAQMPVPVYMIRAGTMIQIDDYDASIAKLTAGQVGTASAIGFVTKTTYDADRNTLSVELGTREETLDMLLLRMGVNPGGVS